MFKPALLVAFLLTACKDPERDPDPETGSSSSGSFDDCQECPVGGSTCPDGQVCAAVLPSGGGVCMLACDMSDPKPCLVDGVSTGSCKAFYPAPLTACNNEDNGPVCP